MLYWSMGDQIRRSALGGQRAVYGERIPAKLSQDLLAEFGRGFELTNLTRMVKFAEVFLDGSVVATLAQQLSWSHAGTASAFQAAAAGAEVLLLQTLRLYMASEEGQRKQGWLRAIFDPQIGDVPKAFLADVAAFWTVESLAAAAGMSRSALAPRLKEMLGETLLEICH